MSEQATLIDEDVPLGEGLICPECGERFKNANGLGLHRSRAHDVAGKNRTAGTSKRTTAKGGSKGAELNRLRRELKKNVNALALLPFMAKGTASNLSDPRVTAIIEEKAEGFADAWLAVAEQNEFVRANLSRALSSTVWLNAAAQTAALGYVVAVFSGFQPMHPGAMMLMPEMAQFFQTPPPPVPEAAATNGSPPVE